MNYEYFYFWGEIHLCTGTFPITSDINSIIFFGPTYPSTHAHTYTTTTHYRLRCRIFSVTDGSVNRRGNTSWKPRVGVLALVSKDDDGSCKVLFRKIVQPLLTDNERLTLNQKYTGVTWADYHNGIRYDDAIDFVLRTCMSLHNVLWRCDFGNIILQSVY